MRNKCRDRKEWREGNYVPIFSNNWIPQRVYTFRFWLQFYFRDGRSLFLFLKFATHLSLLNFSSFGDGGRSEEAIAR
jgi:hypothetical protein